LNSGVWSLRLLGMGDTSAVRLLAPPVLNLSSCPIFRVHFNLMFRKQQNYYLHNDIGLRDCLPDEPENAHSHLLAMLVGSSEVIPIVNGDPDLGRWQSVMLVELDGPRERTVSLRLFGE